MILRNLYKNTMANEIVLQEGHPIDDAIRPLKISGEKTALEIASENNGARVTGNLEITERLDLNSIKTKKTITFEKELVNSVTTGTVVIDWNESQKQKLTITGTGCTVSFTNPPGACNLILKVIQGDGSDTVGTWDSDIKWAGSSAPTLSTGSADIDLISFYFDGTNYLGAASLDFG